MTWQDIAADKKRRIAESIPQQWRIDTTSIPKDVMDVPQKCGFMTTEELAITQSSAVDLVQKMSKGQLTSVQVTTAFCKRAALAHQTLNCSLEFFPDMALKRAREVDDYLAKNGRTIGPLHGLPVSLKDQFRIKGIETTMGYVSWVGKFETDESVLVTLLYQAGAVLYTKTSVPQTLMVCETLNNIIGRTVNPRNSDWSCGGSSGGEGAIVGFRGAVIGVGTDIGGSIRVPAAFNFLYGLRPSHGRLPYAKMANSMEGQETVHSVCGPICHSMPDLKLFVTSILGGKPWLYDPKVIPMPWRQDEEDAARAKINARSLSLAYYNCDGNVLPHPPILRGIQTVVVALRQAGHSVDQWTPYKHPEAIELIESIYASDGGTDVAKVMRASGEPAIPNFSDLMKPSLKAVDMNKLWDIQLKRTRFQSDYLEEIRKFEQKTGKELDAIVAPITPSAAVRHNQFKYYGYASAINLLDFTSVVVPITFADKAVDVANTAFKPLTNMDAQVQAEYDPEAYHGAPVAVQVIGRRLTEEKIMAIAEEVGKLVRGT